MKHKHNTPIKLLTTVLLLLLSLAVTLSGCAYPSNQVGDSESTTTTATTTTATTTTATTTTATTTTGRADGLKKIYCQATLEDDFVDNKILFGVFPEYNEYEYTVDDFADVGCIDYKEIMTYKPGKPNSRIMRITLDKHSKENVLAMIKKLEEREDIRYAEPSYYQSIEAVANDIQYTNGNQWAIDKIDLPAAWDITTGVNTVYVGVLDTGIEATHPDLVNRVSTSLGRRFDGSFLARSHLEDSNGHGTHVAGIIGAEGDNTIGITGTCWDVKLVSIAICSYAGFPENEHVIDGIEYAEQIGIDILNYSGGTTMSTYAEAYYNAISSFSGLFVCSAGNLKEGENQSKGNNDVYPHYPSNLNLPNVIAVGASTQNDTKAERSHYGANTVDIFAPGEGILSCYPEWICEGSCDEPETHTATYYHTLSGTSMAAPYVTGVAALMLSSHPDLTATQIKNIIMSSVDKVDALTDLCVSGGRLNAYKALTHKSIHTICSYENNGVSVGHTVTCLSCDVTYSESHTWITAGLKYRCGKCGVLSSAIPVLPFALSPEICNRIEQMNYVGDFAMDIGDGTVLCRVGDDYYLVRGHTEDTALQYLQHELSVIPPDLESA